MLSYVVVAPRILKAIETSLSPPLILNVPVTGPEVEPKIRFTLTDPSTVPWAWKLLLAIFALKLSSVDIGVGVGVAVGVESGNNGQAGTQAATEPRSRSTAAPRARRRTSGNEDMSRFLT